MRTPRVLAPGELEETGDFDIEAATHQPTAARGSLALPAGSGLAWISPHLLRLLKGSLATGDPIAASSSQVQEELLNALRETTFSRGALAQLPDAAAGHLHAVVSASYLASLLPLYYEKAHAVHRAESAHDIAQRMALESPAVAVEPFTPVASDNPARDLRDWTQLTTAELAKMCRVTGRRFHHWLGGARMSSKSEERLLRLRYQAGILATGFGPAGVRRWFRAPHPELGNTPIEAIADGREDTVRQLVERYIESPAT